MQARFLILGDDGNVGTALKRALSALGASLLADTVRDADRMIDRREPWTAFFIEVHLPDGSGLDFLARARRCYSSTPALVLSGHADADTINRAHDLGASYIVKPIVAGRIERFVRTHAPLGERLETTSLAWAARHALSIAEHDVLLRAARGESRDAIAIARCCSVLTVKKHIVNLLQKTTDDTLHAAVERIVRETAGDRACVSASD